MNTTLNIVRTLLKSIRENIRHWCDWSQIKRKNTFTYGGEGNFENNNYIRPDLVTLKICEKIVRNVAEGQWIETDDRFDSDDLITRIIDADNKLPGNYIIEVNFILYFTQNQNCYYRDTPALENRNCYITLRIFGQTIKTIS
jgi:hypothetical protein